MSVFVSTFYLTQVSFSESVATVVIRAANEETDKSSVIEQLLRVVVEEGFSGEVLNILSGPSERDSSGMLGTRCPPVYWFG